MWQDHMTCGDEKSEEQSMAAQERDYRNPTAPDSGRWLNQNWYLVWNRSSSRRPAPGGVEGPGASLPEIPTRHRTLIWSGSETVLRSTAAASNFGGPKVARALREKP